MEILILQEVVSSILKLSNHYESNTMGKIFSVVYLVAFLFKAITILIEKVIKKTKTNKDDVFWFKVRYSIIYILVYYLFEFVLRFKLPVKLKKK